MLKHFSFSLCSFRFPEFSENNNYSFHNLEKQNKTKQALVSLQMKVKMGMAQRNVLENLKWAVDTDRQEKEDG